jgi:hypothetical protein
MGEKVVQNYVFFRKAVIALQEMIEEEWGAARLEAVKRLEISHLACFVFLGYARALRGEETTKIEMSGVRKYFADGALEPRHVTLSLIGRLKQMEGGQQKFLPVAAETGSGSKIREKVGRFLDEKARVGLTTGFMFLKKDGMPAKAIYFKEALVEKLEWIQHNTSGIIPLTINLWEEFGVRRSVRREATTEALNAGIDGPK